MSSHLPSISVIVTTYNWPEALDVVLRSLCAQNYLHYEIIVADDGSNDETAKVVRKWQAQSRVPLIHCWQPDEGFRAAMIRNRASAIAKHDYLIFIDGDCVPFPDFVLSHAKLAEKGWFVAGNRVLLSQHFSQHVLVHALAIERWSFRKWLVATSKRHCNRFLPLLSLPLAGFRKRSPKKWEGAKTCNLGLWRQDLIAVNGLDEAFTGWGFEDSDLVIRLQRAHIFRKSGKFAVAVLHLWHSEQDRKNIEDNRQRLQLTLQSADFKASSGMSKYLDEHQFVSPLE